VESGRTFGEADPILTSAIPKVPIPTLPRYRVMDRVRVSDRVRHKDKLHLWLRRTQTVTLFPQLQACCNVTFVAIGTCVTRTFERRARCWSGR